MSAFTPHSHLPFSESGTYSENVTGQFDVVNVATGLVLKAADAVHFDNANTTPFVVCDYATADGGVSLTLMRKLLELLKRKYGSEQCIQVFYEDQASNDFNALFKLLHGPDSYTRDFKHVYIHASGTNFYNQCFPSNSLHLGFCSTAMHYLYERPCRLTDALQESLATEPTEKHRFAEYAARDWERLLLLRAEELVEGGQLVILCPYRDDQGQYLGNTHRVKESIFQQFTQLWRGMVDEKMITREEFINTTFNSYYRSTEELKAPLLNPQSPVYKAGLRLVSIDSKVVECCYQKAWLASGNSPDNIEAARAHSKLLVASIRFWANCNFLAGLSDQRTKEEKEGIVEEFFRRYKSVVAENPSDHAMDFVHAHIHIEKVKMQQ